MIKLQFILVAALVGLSGALSGCASGPAQSSKASEPAKSARTEVYLQGMAVTPLNSVGESCSSVKTQSWKTLINKASACAKSGQWGTVDELAYELSRLDVDSPWGLYFFSLSAEARNDYPRALWMIEAAIKKASPQVALFRYQKGRVLWSVKPSEAALKEIEAAAKVDPSLVDAHVFLGQARLRSWDLSTAEKHFSAALQKRSSHYEAIRGMADCKRLQGQAKESIPYFSQALQQKPADLLARVYLAAAYEEEKLPSEALAAYRSLKESLTSGLIKDKPDFDLNEKIRSLENAIAATEAKGREQANARNPADKGAKK